MEQSAWGTWMSCSHGHHVETGPGFQTITDVIKLLFVIYFWHNKARGTYDTYIVRSHHERLVFPLWNQQSEIVYADVLHVNADRIKRKTLHLKLNKTNQQVKHCIWIKKYLFFVNTNATHNVPELGYNKIDVARIVFIFVCVRVCVLFCYWLSHFTAIVHRWIIG